MKNEDNTFLRLKMKLLEDKLSSYNSLISYLNNEAKAASIKLRESVESDSTANNFKIKMEQKTFDEILNVLRIASDKTLNIQYNGYQADEERKIHYIDDLLKEM